MREVITKVYQYDELSEAAKERARNWFREGYDSSFEWECLQEDAANIGLRILSLDQHRRNEGKFMKSATFCAESILKEYGATCETYKTAHGFLKDLENCGKDENGDFIDEDGADEIVETFLHDLLEDYRIMLDKEIDFANSDDEVSERIQNNEYEFTEDGKRA